MAALARAALAAALALTVLVAVSCGGAGAPSGSPTASATPAPSGIRGIVLLAGGPYVVSPSPLPGGFGSGTRGHPYTAVTVRVTAISGSRAGSVVARLRPDPEALFTVALPPGVYELKPLVPPNGPFPQTTTVVVRAGSFTRAAVYVSAP